MKSVIKSTALAVIFALGTINQTQASGIPTFDGAAFSGQVQTWLIEAQRWTSQIKQYKQDFDNQKAQLKSLTGARDIDGFLNALDGVLGSSIQNIDKWMENSDQILKYGKDILSGDLKKIFESYELDFLCKNKAYKQRKNCEGEIIIDSLNQFQRKENIKSLKSRVDNIQNIANRMKSAKDMKEAQDLGNAMQAQIALLNADKMMFELMRDKAEHFKSIIEKKKKDEIERKNANFKYSIE